MLLLPQSPQNPTVQLHRIKHFCLCTLHILHSVFIIIHYYYAAYETLIYMCISKQKTKKTNSVALSPRANYTD
jgi:hypothetical protein